MSIEAIAWASRLTLPPRDKFVLVALCDHYNRDERAAWMKQETLAEWTGYSRATVNAALVALENEHKVIKSETRRYKDGRNAAKVYRLNFSVKEIDSGESRVNEVYTDKVNAVDTDRVKEIDNKNLEHRTVNQEPKKREGKADAFDPLKVDLPPNVSVDAWTDFIAYRRERRLPVTPTHTRRLLERLSAAGADADAMLVQTIENGWQGVFDLKDKPALARPNNPALRAAEQATSLLAHLEGRRAS